MSNIYKAFENGKAYMPFFICGDPDLDTTAAAVREAGPYIAYRYLAGRPEGRFLR